MPGSYLAEILWKTRFLWASQIHDICIMGEEYKVSARKYRPFNWDTVVGQQSIKETLQRAIETEQLGHAYLFCGPRGVGKTTCARIFAKAINGWMPGADGSFDDKTEDDSAYAFNIFELDAASNNSVEDIRSLMDQVRIPPQTGKYKVYVIDEVHMLSSSAFNAFLKTLEEPPAHAKFVLATTEKHKILPTIISRCQVFDFNRISTKDMVDHLSMIAKKEGVKAEAEALQVIAQKADGALRDALSIFDQAVAFAKDELTYQAVINNLNILDYDYYFKITDQLVEGNISASLLTMNEILQGGFDGHLFLSGLGEHYRNLLVSKDQGTMDLLEISGSVKDRYLDQGAKTDVRWLIEAMNILSKADIRYKSSKNHRLLVELSLMQVASIVEANEKKKPVDSVPS